MRSLHSVWSTGSSKNRKVPSQPAGQDSLANYNESTNTVQLQNKIALLLTANFFATIRCSLFYTTWKPSCDSQTIGSNQLSFSSSFWLLQACFVIDKLRFTVYYIQEKLYSISRRVTQGLISEYTAQYNTLCACFAVTANSQASSAKYATRLTGSSFNASNGKCCS